ncbi:MAG: dienelactone hydrolase family protein [Candidatus Micrarchaeia archaeon]
MLAVIEENVKIPAGRALLEGMLAIPPGARAVVVFAHGSGSSRFSPRNNFVARVLRERGLATLLFDLLTPEEDAVYENRFDIALLTERLIAATQWLLAQPRTKNLAIGYFGASTGSACALRAAAKLGEKIGAVVSRGGRPDLTGEEITRVRAPTLLIVGGNDFGVVELNRAAFAELKGEKRLEIIPGATHLFEEPGALEKVAELAAEWFAEHLTGKKGRGA